MPFELTDVFLTELREAIRKEDAAYILDQFKDLYAPDIAEIFNELDAEEAKFVYKQLDETIAADVLIELD